MTRTTFLLLVLGCAGCGWEHYYGPFELTVPTPLREMVDARTFQLPLDGEALEELEQQAQCLQETPDRDPPCICDFPGLRTGDLRLRVDYRLELLAGGEGTVMIFLGLNVAAGEPLPGEVPERPEIKVLTEHHHFLRAGSGVNFSLFEEECEQTEQVWAGQRYASCQQPPDRLPGFTETVIGILQEAAEGKQAAIRAELVFHIRGGE